jgi:hypothetical protein
VIVAFVIVGELIVGLVSVLFVNVWDDDVSARVTEAFGSVYVRVVAVVIPESWNWAFFVVSLSSTRVNNESFIEKVLVLSIVLLERV